MSSDLVQRFNTLIRDVHLAEAIEAVLDWDQETYMPPKGAEQRAAQGAFMAGLRHERVTSDELGRLIHQLEQHADGDPVITTNVREMRRMFNRAVKLPRQLVEDIARTSMLAKSAWVAARKENNFARFAPHLDKLLDLKRQVADRLGYTTEPYDALMDEFEPGAKAAEIERVFDGLRKELVPLVQAIAKAPQQPDLDILKRHCPRAAQEAFGRKLVEAIGFDFEAGRIDVSTHPFCSGTSPLDVRLTTRYDEHYMPMAIFGLLHEAGHGLYEQGLDPDHAGTPAGKSVSLGIHESQSRMWENLVGRSRFFWECYYPECQAAFPSLANVALDDWYFAINNVRPSFIRVEADEVTYNLHIMLRFTLERQLIAGKLAVQDVPAAWNDNFKSFLGLTPPNDAEGCLQDIHWSMGIFGYFPTYALGNLYASQFFAAAHVALPDLDSDIAAGRFAPLREWLREQIHTHGQRYRAAELCERVTGGPLTPAPFLAYLRQKYQPLYGF